MTELSPGTRVQYSDGRQGVIRFIGSTHFSTGLWVGIELDDDSGKNDGTVQGQRYFECIPGHGMFVRPDTVNVMHEQPPYEPADERADKPVIGTAMKSRQSNISAETARKRQSLMGSRPQRPTPGSRLSIIVSRWYLCGESLADYVSSVADKVSYESDFISRKQLWPVVPTNSYPCYRPDIGFKCEIPSELEWSALDGPPASSNS
jgi:CAP-Gly domain